MIHDLIVHQFTKTLRNLEQWLDKGAGYADTKKFDSEVLIQSRLAPDQFPLVRQVQIACDTAKFAAARLAGKEAPAHDDKEKSIADLKTRVRLTVDYLQTFTAKDFTGGESRRITTPRWNGKSLSGSEYLLQHALPNFYFHATTTYAILRHNGVDVGKGDFLGEMPYRLP